MILNELVAAVATDLEIDRRTAKKLADGLFARIKTTVEDGGSVNVPGLGSFVLKERAAIEMTNPETGTSREVSAARYVTLRPARAALGKPEKARKPKSEDATAS